MNIKTASSTKGTKAFSNGGPSGNGHGNGHGNGTKSARGIRPGSASGGESEAVLSPLDLPMDGKQTASVEAGEMEPMPATGKIRLNTGAMTQNQLLAQLQRTNVGMNGTPAYSALPIMADVSAAASGFTAKMGNLAVMETQLKELRLEVTQWAQTYATVLNQAALACENADSTPATLISGGWDLRKSKSAPQPLPAPEGLHLMQTGYPGQGTGRWKKQANAHYYELRVDPVPGGELTITEGVTLVSSTTRCALPPVAPGTQVMICVRSVGSRGPSPYCDPVVVRVN